MTDENARRGDASLAGTDQDGDAHRRVLRVEHGWCLVSAAAPADPAREDGACVPEEVDPGPQDAACVPGQAAGTGDAVRRVRCTLPVAVGDWVRVSADDDPSVLAIDDRRTAVTRRDPSGLTQVLAANVDLVLVTVPADRPSPARVEREVTIAWDSGAIPVVLLTKADLDDGSICARLAERLAGVDVHPVSSETGDGLETVRALLRPDRTAVLLGPSGAGKSTLVNRLLGREATVTGPVREGDHRGRHSTTFRELHALPGGGYLIDTPGLRSLALAVDEGAVEAAFPDVAELAVDCRFRDCTHEHEPGCAVILAVHSGTLTQARLDSYRKLARETDYQRRRDDPVAAREARAVWKARSKAARQLFKERGSR